MLRLIEASATLAVSLASMKAHLNVNYDDDDALITAYIKAAQRLVEHDSNRILLSGLYEWRLDGWPEDFCKGIELPVSPVRNVLTVSYIDDAGDEQEIDADLWDWENTASGAVLFFDAGFAPPSPGRLRGGIRIGIEAGYDPENGPTGTGDDPDLEQPAAAIQAIKLIVGHYYEMRAAVSEKAATEIPLGAQRLIESIRVYR